ncbi:MAG: hypothetical protein BIFFINMI_01472 [Phycisphaerae bacterium]|nr:hypothetical protein [Phycisphaerae bacterium]
MPARLRGPRALAGLGLLASLTACMGRPALALIDPSFTPVELVRDARRIVAGKLEAAADADHWRLAEPRFLKGPKSREVGLSLAVAATGDARDARECLAASAGQDVVLFEAEESSYMLISTVWMEIKSVAGRGYEITEFRDQRLPKTWAGAADKLIPMVDYILHDDDADVPVAVGVKWRGRVPVGQVGQPAVAISALSGGTASGGLLLAASPGGDRLWGYDKTAGRFDDRTLSAGLDTSSRAMALIDLNGDGRADLASWDGRLLKVRLSDASGEFVASNAPADIPLEGDCRALWAVGPSQDGSPGLLADMAWPRLLTLTAQGWQVTRLPGDPAAQAPVGEAWSCVVADWDDDGYVDVLQIRPRESLLWRGCKGGFRVPAPCVVTSGGQERPPRWCVGDFDGDGRPDLFVCGARTNELWENVGGGKFQPVARLAGSLYTLGREVADCIATDLNHDGRTDIAILSAGGTLGYHFNRGYRCLADEGTLKLDIPPSTTTQPEQSRPMRLASGDLDGDGCLDLAVACADGHVFGFLNGRSDGQGRPPGLAIRLPSGRSGPVTVSVWQGGPSGTEPGFPVCTGTYLVQGGTPWQAAFAPLRRPGVCTLKWRWPGGGPCGLVVKEPSDVVLSPPSDP